MRKILSVLFFAFCAVSLYGVAVISERLEAEDVSVRTWIDRGDARLATIHEENIRKAVTEYESALRLDPESYEANWKMARAYCLILDIKTNIMIEEKKEYKPFLKDLGEKAGFYGAKAYAANPKGLDALVWYNGSYAYHASSMGIIKAILNGAGAKVKILANELIKQNDRYHGAFGYRILGRFYLNAPFPIGSRRKAMEHFKKAVDKAPADLQNHYWLGEAYRREGRAKEAKEQFEFVAANPPADIEAHLAGILKQYAQKYLDEINKS